MVAIYVIVTILSGIAPKRILDRHIVKPRQILELELTLEESFQVASVAVGGVAVLFFISLYGARGNFYDEREAMLFYSFLGIGALSLLGTAVWKGLVIRKEMNQEQENSMNAESRRNAQITQDDAAPLSKVSHFWVGFAFVLTTLHTALGYWALACMWSKEDDETKRTKFTILTTILITTLPVVIVVYCISVFARPKENGWKTIYFMHFHFATFVGFGELSWVLIQFRRQYLLGVIQV